MIIDAPGIYDLPAADYHADPCPEPSLSSSIAKVICLESARHAWAQHQRLNPHYVRAEKDHFDLGTAVHAVLLEGVDQVVVVDAADWRTNRAKEARDAARAEGKIPLLPPVHHKVLAMVEAAQWQLAEHATVDNGAMFRGGQAEQTLVWREGPTWCRARLDYVRPALVESVVGEPTQGWAIDDYKTAASANPDEWTRSMFRFGYDLQAAWYQRGVQAVTGAPAVFRFAVQETEPPYALAVMALAPSTADLAEKKRRYALELWAQCLAADCWPGYPIETCYVQLPATHESWWLEKECR
jgi:hypothetical protein